MREPPCNLSPNEFPSRSHIISLINFFNESFSNRENFWYPHINWAHNISTLGKFPSHKLRLPHGSYLFQGVVVISNPRILPIQPASGMRLMSWVACCRHGVWHSIALMLSLRLSWPFSGFICRSRPWWLIPWISPAATTTVRGEKGGPGGTPARILPGALPSHQPEKSANILQEYQERAGQHNPQRAHLVTTMSGTRGRRRLQDEAAVMDPRLSYFYHEIINRWCLSSCGAFQEPLFVGFKEAIFDFSLEAVEGILDEEGNPDTR